MWLFCIFYVFGLQIYRVWVRVRICKKTTLDKNVVSVFRCCCLPVLVLVYRNDLDYITSALVHITVLDVVHCMNRPKSTV